MPVYDGRFYTLTRVVYETPGRRGLACSNFIPKSIGLPWCRTMSPTNNRDVFNGTGVPACDLIFLTWSILGPWVKEPCNELVRIDDAL